MCKLSVFNQVSLDGYFSDRNGDMSWAHKHDAEWRAFMSENASLGGALVFGRVTYELMASYWPTAAARNADPVVAEMMTSVPKIVFSRTLGEPSWANTTVVSDDLVEEVRKMKRQPGPEMVILGSGTIVAQLTAERLIDAYTIVMNPIVLGSGRTIFDGVQKKHDVALKRTRVFENGNIVLWYDAAPTLPSRTSTPPSLSE